MHKAIIFDLGKVLVHFDFQPAYRALESVCPHPAAEIRRLLAGTNLVERFETGLVEPHDFAAQVTSLLSLRVDYSGFCDIWNSIFRQTLVPESLLEGLAARYPLLLLSNTNAIHFPMIRDHYPLVRHFRDFILSYEVKAMKPRPEIFRAAIARAGCRPGECFYTDDIPGYVEAAKGLGMDAVTFESAGQLEKELRARGIAW